MDSDKALERLRELCDRGEYCTSEINDKLKRWGIPPSVANRIIVMLKKERLIDDTRYANSIARSKAVFSYWGKRKIRMYLATKHIAPSIIAEALEGIDTEEYESALKHIILAKKRQLGEEAATYEGRIKIYRFALLKGFESSLISSVLKNS